MINVAQSAVGVANAHPTQCVVLISDEISLRDLIAKLDSENLCAIPSAVARQWSRTDQAPPIVHQSIKYLQKQIQKQISEATNQFPRQTDTIYLGTSSSSPNAEQKIKDDQKVSPNYGQIAINLVKFGLATTFLVAILLFGWRLAQPQKFQQFWKKNGLPPLPKILVQPNQPKQN
jgi:ABC-type long-subunit fatty acid transport system fused permease/ATPase subunit